MDALFNLLSSKSLEIEGLSPEENREIALRRREALTSTGRLELDACAIHELAQIFIAEFGALPPDTVDAFYELRDELSAAVPDAGIIDALVAAVSRLGGDIAELDVSELARQVRQKDDSLSSYAITDDAGRTYCWDPQHWDDNEQAPGWDGEGWEADYDD